VFLLAVILSAVEESRDTTGEIAAEKSLVEPRDSSTAFHPTFAPMELRSE